jgi:hypothetical protein
MRFIDADRDFPISSAVVHGGKVFEAVVTGIPDGSHEPVAGGAGPPLQVRGMAMARFGGGVRRGFP